MIGIDPVFGMHRQLGVAAIDGKTTHADVGFIESNLFGFGAIGDLVKLKLGRVFLLQRHRSNFTDKPSPLTRILCECTDGELRSARCSSNAWDL